jgi:hypothetical protein
MRRYFFIFILCFLSFDIYATQNVSFDININKNVTISVCWLAIGGHDYLYLCQDGLYWDLLIWGKNAQNQLLNKTGNINFFIDPLSNKIEVSKWTNNRKIILKKTSYKEESEIKNIVLNTINTFFNIKIDINNNTPDSIEVFLVNYEDSGMSIGKGVFCQYIFFTMEGATDYIKNETEQYKKWDIKRNYFVEKIVLTKRNINNVHFIS